MFNTSMNKRLVCIAQIYMLFCSIAAVPCSKKKPNCERIFIWKRDRQEFISLLNVTFTRPGVNDLKTLEGKTVRVAAGNILPYIESSNDTQKIGGFLGDIWNLIEDLLRFKSSILSLSYDDGFEAVDNGKADVMLSAVVAKLDLNNVEYSQPYFYNWYHLYMKQPSKSASSLSYLRTLSSQLWYASLTLFTILTVSVWLTTKFLNSAYQLEPNVSIPSCFLTVAGGFINQGFDLKLRSYSGRIQVICALFLGYLIFSAMNAVLVAKLAIFEVRFPFKSIDDVAIKRTHSLCIRTESFVYNNFTDDNHRLLKKWKGIVNGAGCLNINHQVNLAKTMCEEKLIFLENRFVVNDILKHYQMHCEIFNLDVKYFEKHNSFLMHKGFDRSKAISIGVNKLAETGLLRRFEFKWVRGNKMNKINTKTATQVTLQHISGILGMYGVMIIISVAILIAEKAYEHYL